MALRHHDARPREVGAVRASVPSPLPRFVAGAAGALLAFFAVYGLFVRTEAGQRLENLALAGALYRDPTEVEGSLQSLSQISVLSFAIALVAVLLVAAVRRKWRLALLSVVVMGVSSVAAELLKDFLPRPALVDAPRWLLPNSFPSGHATVAVSIGVGAMLVAPERFRWLVLPLGAAYAALIAQAVQVAGWHRLSGTLGAAFLVISVASIALAILAARGFVRPSSSGRVHPWVIWMMLLVIGAALASAAVVAILPLAFPVLHAPSGADSAFAHTALDLLGIGLTMLSLVLFQATIEPYSLGQATATGASSGAPVPARS